MTQESASPHAEIHNATCGIIGNSVATSATACYYGRNGNVYDTTTPLLCTIGVGQTSCPFSLNWYVSPSSLPAHVKFAASTVVTPADKDVFLVVTPEVTCSSDAKGCTEYGKPKFNQGRTATTGADSVFLKNDPATYADTLCTQDALFCSAWTGTGGTQYYFKDPGTKTCEYRTDVTVGTSAYDGWFKTGTNEFCYNSPNYIIGGNTSGIWKNGDAQYAGWVGTCAQQYDSCSEYQDPLDVGSDELYGGASGAQYFSLASSVSSAHTAAAGDCNGKVSLKQGCALFNDTSIAAKTASSSATEMASRHADALFNTAQFSLVDPINCDSGSSVITKPDGSTVDLCAQRCVYNHDRIHDITHRNTDPAFMYGSSCYTSDDCAVVDSEAGEKVAAAKCGTTDTSGASVPRLSDDTNTVLAVNRDRQCSEWLSCADAQTVWDERTNSYKTVCGDVELCTEYSAQGSSSFCSKWNFEDPKVVLDAERYTSRDVTWYGDDYSGFAIPDSFPVQTLKQANVAPPAGKCDLTIPLSTGVITQSQFDADQGDSCSSGADCAGLSGAQYSYVCPQTQTTDYRLVLNAGECSNPNGTSCTVGTCANTGSACVTTDDCGSSGGSCVVGQCLTVQANRFCTSDSQCSTGQVCSGGQCATPGPRVVTDSPSGTDRTYVPASPSTSCASGQTFASSVGLKTGTCVNEQCLLAPSGDPFVLGTTSAKSCRAYPEVNSPFSSEIVESWFDTENQEKLASGSPSKDDIPYDTRSGFENAKFCASGEDCLCSYKKVTYGQGGESRYYNKSYAANGQGICSTGTKEGAFCDNDSDCTDDPTNNPGTCAVPTREDLLLGLDGYCLEWDTSINVNGDRDQNACLTWLPVDQLAGSSDLYGKNTSAGFDGNLFYCAEVQGYNNMKPKLACAELPAGGGANSSNRTTCSATVACPDGFWAVGGPANASNSDNDPHSAAGNACERQNNACPYMCIPYNSFHESGVSAGSACKSPSEEGLDVDTQHFTDTQYGHTELYFADDRDEQTMYEDIDELFAAYKDCTYYGTSVKGDELGILTFDSSGDIVSTHAGDDYDLIAGGELPDGYPACKSLLQAASADPSTYNAVWTDRLLNPNSDLAQIMVGTQKYTIDTVLSPWAHAITAQDANGGTFNPGADPTPAIIPACVDDSSGYTAHRPPDVDHPTSCTESGYTTQAYGNDQEQAQTYLDWQTTSVQFESGSTHGQTIGGETTLSSVANRLRQLIALPVGLWNWGNGTPALSIGGKGRGEYAEGVPSGLLAWDDRATQGNPPTVWSIDPATCKGSECEEGPSNSLTVNDQNSGELSSNSFLRASLKFYAAADKNQLPLRRVIVDWGDGGNYSGSASEDNFYKNHRGLQDNSTNSKCDLDTEWGLTSESCDPNYLTYSHIYTCPSSMILDSSKACANNDPASASNGPCVVDSGTAEAACVYQPRVHVRDNWGWCAGTCNNTNGCYDGDGSLSAVDQDDQCNYASYPRFDSSLNPWVYYGGTVTVKP
jgi:hypothetical protein